MQDDNMSQERGQEQPGPPLHPEPPASHDHVNREGMTNGVPDAASEGEPTGGPHSDRHGTETAASDDTGS